MESLANQDRRKHLNVEWIRISRLCHLRHACPYIFNDHMCRSVHMELQTHFLIGCFYSEIACLARQSRRTVTVGTRIITIDFYTDSNLSLMTSHAVHGRQGSISIRDQNLMMRIVYCNDHTESNKNEKIEMTLMNN
jgi:hypothetical protein